MAHLKEVESRINSVASIQKITKAMKLVAASKLYNMQQRLHYLIPYVEKLTDIFYHTVNNAMQSQLDNSYLKPRKIKKNLIIAITADKGLCGAFNKNVFKTVIHYIEEHKISNKEVDILAIGKKTVQFFEKKQIHLISTYVDLITVCNVNFLKISKATQNIMHLFQQGIYDRIVLIYNTNKHAVQYETTIIPFLPIISHNSNHITPLGIDARNTIYEPSRSQIIDSIVPDLLKMKLYTALVESNTAEYAARMITMSQATDNADSLLKELRLTYNRRRQNLITRTIAEIVGGAEALSE